MSLQITQSHIPSFQIHLNSQFASLLVDSSKRSHVWFVFNEPVRIPRAYKFLVSLTECAIPCSWYTVNETNNVLTFSEGPPITLPVGNWDATSIANYVTIGGIPCTYVSETNKFQFTRPAQEPMLYLGPKSTIFGFTGPSTAAYNPLLSDTGIDLSGSRSVFIKTNLVTQNIDSFHKGRSGVLAKIPVDVNPGEILMYSNPIGFKQAIQTKTINVLEVSVLDESHSEIDFNGLDWSMTLQFDVAQDNDPFVPDEQVPQLSSEA